MPATETDPGPADKADLIASDEGTVVLGMVDAGRRD
jgi:hypothetical protein